MMHELDWQQKYIEIWDHLRYLSPTEIETEREYRMYDAYKYPIIERNYCYIFYFHTIDQELLQAVSDKFNVSYTIMSGRDSHNGKVMVAFTERKKQIQKDKDV
jgi:hypothetical protein